MLKYKHIEAAREVRQWIVQLGIPAVAGSLLLFPELRQKIVDKVHEATAKIHSK